MKAPVVTLVLLLAIAPTAASAARTVGLYDKRGGPATALLGYYVARLSGWRILDLGSAEVGCAVPAKVFRGRKSAVLQDLALGWPW